MARVVKIPEYTNGLIIKINGQKYDYSYKNGQTLEVPDEVADIIDGYWAFKEASKPKPPSAGGGVDLTALKAAIEGKTELFPAYSESLGTSVTMTEKIIGSGLYIKRISDEGWGVNGIIAVNADGYESELSGVSGTDTMAIGTVLGDTNIVDVVQNMGVSGDSTLRLYDAGYVFVTKSGSEEYISLKNLDSILASM